MVTIAVDAMGGDFAPEAVVRGALECVQTADCDFKIALYGIEEKITPFLKAQDALKRIRVVHASEVIEMHDSATTSIKTRKDSSILKALEAHKNGDVDAFISAGNTGAVMAASTLILGRLPGVSRPTIGTFLPSQHGMTLLVDAGANVDSKPLHLLQFGIMGSKFTEEMLQIQKPKVGLLNVGEEEGKGNDVSIEAYRLLKEAPINFIGNIEGRDIITGTVDVAVCDGFVGNIILKFAESVPDVLKSMFRSYAETGFFQKLKMASVKGSLKIIFKSWDYQEQGGVPLLGVNGVSIIGHGSSSPKAIRNMIYKAKEMIDRRVNDRIAEALHTASQSIFEPRVA